MSATTDNPQPLDASQQQAIEAQGECLVLAPPGCGKTFVLTERIRHAHQQGVAYEDMLCLTFTNRAARQMRERIRQYIDDDDAEKVYVGNVHRFCARFLLNNNVISQEATIIDDDDAFNIIAQYLDEDVEVIKTKSKRLTEYRKTIQLAGFMRQIERSHPKDLRIHPDCLNRFDIKALSHICDTQGFLFTSSTMHAIYREATDYKSIVKGKEYPTEWQDDLEAVLHKMEIAHFYHTYKSDNHLLDFNDLLITTYDLLIDEEQQRRTTGVSLYKHYSWCEVDEVQDLNPLQLKIIDLLLVPDNGATPRTVMYLGDEYQAIYSFMGAK